MKDKKLLFKYLDMIRTCWDTFFIERYEEGMKGMLFAGRVEMCDEIVETFRKEYPHLKTMRYTADDEYENLLEADIPTFKAQIRNSFNSKHERQQKGYNVLENRVKHMIEDRFYGTEVVAIE